MQSSTGEHHQQQQTPYFLGAACDPNLLAFALSYPHHKNMYPQAFQSAQMAPLMLPQSALLPAMHQLANRSIIPSLTAAIPEMDKLSSLDEPIEAGSMAYRRSNNKSTSVSVADDSFNNLQRSTSSSHFRRHSAQWETMTDDEREMVQRQKRKEEAFKTALCDAFKRNGSCPYGEACRFAHGENELRMPSQPRGKAHPKYKTQLCDKFSTYGQCPYGPRCQFIHKLKKGLPLLEYNRALYQGRISPARDDEITNPDETPSDDQSVMNLTRNITRRRSSSNGAYLDMSDSGYGGGGRRRLHHQFEQCEDQQQPRGKPSIPTKVVYPPMQVVNIEMATGQKKSSVNGTPTEHSNSTRRQRSGSQSEQLPSVIDQADYEASMASGKMFGKPENIRTYGAMIRANEDHVERNQTGTGKKDRVKAPTMRRDLSLIREEDTLLVDGSQLQCTSGAAPISSSQTTNTLQAEEQPWYEKIFGKMTMIREESIGDEDDDSRLLAHDDIDYAK